MLKEVGETAPSHLLGREVSNYGGRQLALELIQPRARRLLLAGWPRGALWRVQVIIFASCPGFQKGI